jgi:hypothetical protein
VEVEWVNGCGVYVYASVSLRVTLRGMTCATRGGLQTIGKGRAVEGQSRGGEEGYHFGHDRREDIVDRRGPDHG